MKMGVAQGHTQPVGQQGSSFLQSLSGLFLLASGTLGECDHWLKEMAMPAPISTHAWCPQQGQFWCMRPFSAGGILVQLVDLVGRAHPTLLLSVPWQQLPRVLLG